MKKFSLLAIGLVAVVLVLPFLFLLGGSASAQNPIEANEVSAVQGTGGVFTDTLTYTVHLPLVVNNYPRLPSGLWDITGYDNDTDEDYHTLFFYASNGVTGTLQLPDGYYSMLNTKKQHLYMPFAEASEDLRTRYYLRVRTEGYGSIEYYYPLHLQEGAQILGYPMFDAQGRLRQTVVYGLAMPDATDQILVRRADGAFVHASLLIPRTEQDLSALSTVAALGGDIREEIWMIYLDRPAELWRAEAGTARPAPQGDDIVYWDWAQERYVLFDGSSNRLLPDVTDEGCADGYHVIWSADSTWILLVDFHVGAYKVNISDMSYEFIPLQYDDAEDNYYDSIFQVMGNRVVSFRPYIEDQNIYEWDGSVWRVLFTPVPELADYVWPTFANEFVIRLDQWWWIYDMVVTNDLGNSKYVQWPEEMMHDYVDPEASFNWLFIK